ncbi:GATOR2 complex protein WDR59-like isoform X3 [Syngnathus typhle]|uniref:GATOR2 complex protein WDR59-like isoform X3 n=1 Tax=Syngnathus typhle TaxID=161592 RepID=UPI002A6B5B14|nr:GATOR2 complex protein WDR59-like isoform X3 [Syngnathus typhle]
MLLREARVRPPFDHCCTHSDEWTLCLQLRTSDTWLYGSGITRGFLSRDKLLTSGWVQQDGGALEQRECGVGVSRRAGDHHVRGLPGLARRAFWAPLPVRGQPGGAVGAGQEDVSPEQVGRGHRPVEPPPLSGARLCRLGPFPPTDAGRARPRFAIACSVPLCVHCFQSNQRVELYSWKDGVGSVHTSLSGHTRVISDLDWSCFEAEFLVSSSVDTYMYIWDIRDTRKPAVALSAVAGASQVKWNRRSRDVLASSHDGDVRIWDRRKPNTACEYVAAHLSKIHGLDWHPEHEFILATSSQDNSVRFWDYRQPRKYLNILSCQVPVWKARYTPFSNGLVTVMVPQLRRENSLLLWSTLDLNSPVHAFVGHDDVILEFQWRPQKEGCKDFQLVTWSRDQTLRIWRVDPQLQKLCLSDLPDEVADGAAAMVESEKTLTSTDSDGQRARILVGPHPQDQDGGRDSTASSGLAQTLQQEFSLVNLQIRNVNVEMDAVNCSCVVSAHFGAHQVRLLMKFPGQYPNNSAPTFQFLSPTSISAAMKTKIHKVLSDVSLQKVKRNQNCLEPCVRKLVSCLESVVEDSPSSRPFVLSNPVAPTLQAFPRVINTYGSYQDANIPFPRTSGARFCGTGCLVYFTRPISMHRVAPPTEPTPRSLSALSAYHSGVLTPMKIRSETQNTLRLYSGSPTRADKDTVSISSFYYKERKSRRFKSKRDGADCGGRSIKLAGKVIIQEISCLLPVHKVLGENYILNMSDTEDTCQKNAAAALAVGRRDVAKVWALASAATGRGLSPDSDPDADAPWASHPFGRRLLETLVEHYSHMSDVQTLAMLCSVFTDSGANVEVTHAAPQSRQVRFAGLSESTMAFACREQPEQALGRSESPEDARHGSRGHVDPREWERERHDMNRRLLDPTNTPQFDDFKKCYAEILYRWDLRDKRADVLKFASCPPEPHQGVELCVLCCHCGSPSRGTQCVACKRLSFQCVVCHVAVRGSSHFCLGCGHGGHTGHMMDWFRKQEQCPAGCGCRCLQQSNF